VAAVIRNLRDVIDERTEFPLKWVVW